MAPLLNPCLRMVITPVTVIKAGQMLLKILTIFFTNETPFLWLILPFLLLNRRLAKLSLITLNWGCQPHESF